MTDGRSDFLMPIDWSEPKRQVMTTASAELLACPFCGGQWKISQEPHDNGYVAGLFYVFHPHKGRCVDLTGHFETREQAVAAINRRAALSSPSQPADDAEVEAVAMWLHEEGCNRFLQRDYAKRLRDTATLLRRLAAPGCVLVPKDEMTDDMMNAGQRYLDSKALNGHFSLPGTFNWHEFYRAMLSAAPAAKP